MGAGDEVVRGWASVCDKDKVVSSTDGKSLLFKAWR